KAHPLRQPGRDGGAREYACDIAPQRLAQLHADVDGGHLEHGRVRRAFDPGDVRRRQVVEERQVAAEMAARLKRPVLPSRVAVTCGALAYGGERPRNPLGGAGDDKGEVAVELGGQPLSPPRDDRLLEAIAGLIEVLDGVDVVLVDDGSHDANKRT